MPICLLTVHKGNRVNSSFVLSKRGGVWGVKNAWWARKSGSSELKLIKKNPDN